MRKIVIFLTVALSSLFFLTGSSCQNIPFVAGEGKKAAELNAAKDDQIKNLKEQVDVLMSQRIIQMEQAALVAANLEGILYAATYLDTSLPRDAIEAEAKLGKARSPESDAAELLKSMERVVAILEGRVKEANALYEAAYKDAALAKKQIEQKSKEIDSLHIVINNKDADIKKLESEKLLEQEENKKRLQEAFDKHAKEKADLEKKFKDKEQAWLMRMVGIGSVLCIFAGIVVIALTKGALWAQGGLLIAGGSFAILLRIGYLSLISAWWFPYAAGIVALLVVVGVIWGLYKMWQRFELDRKKAAALQDLRDESAVLKDGTWEKVEEHLKYRIGDGQSYWGKVQKQELQEMGLIEKQK